MKKYKLIKWYPSLPKDYEEGKVYAFVKDLHVCKNEYRIDISEARNSPEFWEEVKDYEILQLSYKGDSENVAPFLSHSLEIEAYERGNGRDNWSIHSAKRLSDGEVFSVGDEVKKDVWYTGEITQLKLEDGKLNVVVDDSWYVSIDKVEKIELPLFTTEDGYEIFEGDEWYMVEGNYTFLCKDDPDDLELIKDGYHLPFKKKENAKQWIEDNKPKYSKKDIENANNKIGMYDMSKKTYFELLMNELNKK